MELAEAVAKIVHERTNRTLEGLRIKHTGLMGKRLAEPFARKRYAYGVALERFRESLQGIGRDVVVGC